MNWQWTTLRSLSSPSTPLRLHVHAHIPNRISNKTPLTPPQKFQKNPLLPPKFHLSPLNLPKTPTPLPSKTPPPLPSPFSSLQQSRPPFLKALAEKLAFLLLASFLFLGRFYCRPVLALEDAPRATAGEAVEETQGRSVERGVDEEEEVLYLKLLERNPRDVDALKALFYWKMRRGRTREAVEYVERLIGVQPNEVEWRLLQAICYELLGQLSTAKRLFKDILAKRPLLLRALHGLALVMHKKHEGPAVFEVLNKALALAQSQKRVSEERSIKILIAQMHVVKGELEEGLKKFQDLINEDPRDFRPHLCQGIIYSLQDKRKEAEEQFEIYHSLVPQEFPQRGFLDEVVIAAKTESREQMQKDFDEQFSYKKENGG